MAAEQTRIETIIFRIEMSAPSARLTLPWRRPRVAFAFSSRQLLALRAGNGSRAIRRDVPTGLVVPGAFTPNIQSVSDAARLASEMVGELESRGATASVILPDLAVVSAVFRGDQPFRAEFAHRLAFPVSEARSDFWRGFRGEVLAAAARQAVVRQYEQVMEAAECRLGWVDAASLVRIPEWAEASGSQPGTTLRAQLYRSHYALALFRGGELVDVRTRLRSGDDADAVAAEIRRLPAMYGLPDLDRVTVSGEGAARCAQALSESNARVSAEDEGEETQLEAILSALLERA
jgi:hypothetical protein